MADRYLICKKHKERINGIICPVDSRCKDFTLSPEEIITTQEDNNQEEFEGS